MADIGELKAKARRRIEFHFDGAVTGAAFAGLPGVKDVSVHGDSVVLTVEGPVDAVVKEAARHTVVTVETQQPSLEEAFLGFYEDAAETDATIRERVAHHDGASPTARVPRLGGGARRGGGDVRGVLPEHPRSAADFQGYMENLPDALRTLIGSDFTTPAGYLRSETFSALGPILMLVFAIGAGSRAIAGEEEGRTLDLLLSTPVRRRHVLVDKWGVDGAHGARAGHGAGARRSR